MNAADKAALKFVGGIFAMGAAAGALDYITCRLHNQKCIEQGQPDKCIVPAIQSAFLAGLQAKFLGPIPLPLQVIDFVLQDRDLLLNPCHTLFCDPASGQMYYVCAQPLGGWTVSFA